MISPFSSYSIEGRKNQVEKRELINIIKEKEETVDVFYGV
jgi:hypothetical protein